MKTETSLQSTLLKSVSEIVVVTLVCLFFVRGIFLNQGQIGHNWDFTFPSFVSSPHNINFLSAYTWNSSNLGYQQHLTAAHLIPNYIYSLLVSILGTEQGTKLLLLSILVVSVFGFAKFSTHIHPKISRPISLLLGLSYAFSPFLFNEIVGGSWYMWLSYAFIPWYLYAILSFFEGKNKHLFPALIFSNLVVSSLQNFVLIHSLLMFYLFLNAKSFKAFLSRFSLLHLFLLFTNLYWIGLTLSNFLGLATQFSSGVFTSQFEQVKNSSQNLTSIFGLYGYLDRDFYFYNLPKVVYYVYNLLVSSVWVSGLFIFFHSDKIISRKKVTFSVLVALCFFVIKGGNPPFSAITMSIFENVPLASLYRSPQHLMLITSIIFLILLVYLIKFVSEKLGGMVSYLFLMLFFLCYSFGWWLKGDLGHQKMSMSNRDFVDFYQTDPYLRSAFKNAEDLHGQTRHLFLPITQSPVYLKTNYQKSAQGGVAEYMYLTSPTFYAESSLQGKEIENAICTNNLRDFENLLIKQSVGYVTLRLDIAPLFTNCSKTWSFKDVVALLEKSALLKKVITSQNVIQYTVVSPQKVLTGISDISFTKISPVEYKFNVETRDTDKDVVLNENFNSHWVIRDSHQKIVSQSKNVNGLNYFSTANLRPTETYYVYFSLQSVYQKLITVSLTFLLLAVFLTYQKNEK